MRVQAALRSSETDRIGIVALHAGRYVLVKPGNGGWTVSPVLGRDVRLTRERNRRGRWRYRLDSKD